MKKYASTIIAAAATLGLVAAAHAGDACSYEGSAFSDGATVCQAGTQFRCADGEWESLAVACPKVGAANGCDFNGNQYSSGSTSCQAGSQFRCDAGTWKGLGVACPPVAGDAPRMAEPSAMRNCMLDGSTVSHTSTVCKSGVMYACDNGEWRNLGTPCK